MTTRGAARRAAAFATLAALFPADAAAPARTHENEAAANCVRLGGTVAVEKRGDGKEFAVCRFPTGRECEVWTLRDGKCPAGGADVSKLATPAARFCAITGGAYRAVSAEGTGNETGVCTLPSGKECDAASYFSWTCRPGSPATPAAAPLEDPFDYCAAVSDVDAPDARYAGPAVPEPVVRVLVEKGLLASDAPEEARSRVLWRCRAREVVAGLPGDATWHVVPRPAPAPASLADANRIRVSRDGRLALLPIDPDNVDAMKELIQSSRFDSHGLNVTLYQPVGLLPQLLVAGEPEAVTGFVATAREMFLPTGRKHLVGISARLTQFSDSEIRDLGLNLFPNSITYDGVLSKATHEGWSGSFDLNVNPSGASNILVADESLGTGRALVASQVFTPNGVKAEISDVQHEPVFSLDTYGNVQTEYRDLETNINVTPVVLALAPEEGGQGRVRLDITVKVSLISGEKRTSNVTAPQYSDKSFRTTRVFPADGRTYLVGSFVSDSDIQSRSGVPFLSSIPIIKYLFSQKSTTRSRNYALLTLAVSVLPDDLTSDELARQQADSTKSAASKGKRKDEDAERIPGILDKALETPEPRQAP